MPEMSFFVQNGLYQLSKVKKSEKNCKKGVDKKVVLWYNIIVLGNEHQKDKVCS